MMTMRYAVDFDDDDSATRHAIALVLRGRWWNSFKTHQPFPHSIPIHIQMHDDKLAAMNIDRWIFHRMHSSMQWQMFDSVFFIPLLLLWISASLHRYEIIWSTLDEHEYLISFHLFSPQNGRERMWMIIDEGGWCGGSLTFRRWRSGVSRSERTVSIICQNTRCDLTRFSTANFSIFVHLTIE